LNFISKAISHLRLVPHRCYCSGKPFVRKLSK
jgi:hypothetical protein